MVRPKLEIEKTCVSLAWGDRVIGCGWWIPGQWKRPIGWFYWKTERYDGWWFGCRLGPFFYCSYYY